MLIVGELINASRKSIGEAIKAEDAETIANIAKEQYENGADYIDVNAGVFVGKEAEYLEWLVKTVQGTVDANCSIDSPDPVGVKAALAVHKGTAMINSISLEKQRYDAILPILEENNELRVIALCMSDDGMPESTEDRVKNADKLINTLVDKKVPIENIYVDPLVQPVATNDTYGIQFLNAIEQIMTEFPGVHTCCGLSNVSYGLPGRKIMNQTFMAMAILKGLDAAIVNPLDKRMIAMIAAAEALAGKDEGCMNYLDAYRAKKLEL